MNRELKLRRQWGFFQDDFGVIMEYSGFCSREEAEAKIASMLEDAFARRGCL